MIFSVLIILVLDTVAATGVIETIPYLPSKEVTRGYSGLLLKTSFKYTRPTRTTCTWSASNGRRIEIFTSFVSCSNRTDKEFFVTCVNTSNTIFSTLKLPAVDDNLLPLNDNNMVWNVNCDGISNPIATLNVTVQNYTEREMKVNELYESTGNTENVRREINDNELYSKTRNNDVTKPPGSNPAAAYGVVKKPKKKAKKPISDVTKPPGSDPAATNAVVNRPEKKKKTSITENGL